MLARVDLGRVEPPILAAGSGAQHFKSFVHARLTLTQKYLSEWTLKQTGRCSLIQEGRKCVCGAEVRFLFGVLRFSDLIFYFLS